MSATRTSNDLIFDLAMRFRHQTGVPSALVSEILERAQKLQRELTASGQTSPDLQHSQALDKINGSRIGSAALRL